MSTIDIPSVPYAQTALERMQERRRWREQIPHFVIPATENATRRLSFAASVPPEFIELTNLAIANHASVVRTEGATPEQIRSLVSYADAYGPLADELEALAAFIRHSTIAARNRAGTEALTTYALAQRLAKLPETAALKPHVADMRRALKRGRKPSPETVARKAAERAAKVAAKAAANAAAETAPDTATEQTS